MNIGSLVNIKSANITGKCSRNGFHIKFKDRVFKTANYDESEKTDFFNVDKTSWKVKFSVSYYALLIGSYLLLNHFFLPKYSSFAGLIAFNLAMFVGSLIAGGYLLLISSVTLMAIMFRIKGSNYETQYHACEHMVAALIATKIEPTIDNLRRMPRVALSCGSMLACAVICSPIYFISTLTLLRFGLFFLFQLAVVFSFIGLMMLSFVLQYALFTSKPSEDKLEESLVLAKEVYAFQNN
jgi:hypothetical protein